jgi:hypothetical protein
MNDIQPGNGRYEELDHRMQDGLAVSLIWWRAENRVSVFVVDSRAGTAFEVPVRDESPLDVFNHPFAYAAFRRIEQYARLGDTVAPAGQPTPMQTKPAVACNEEGPSPTST